MTIAVVAIGCLKMIDGGSTLPSPLSFDVSLSESRQSPFIRCCFVSVALPRFCLSPSGFSLSVFSCVHCRVFTVDLELRFAHIRSSHHFLPLFTLLTTLAYYISYLLVACLIDVDVHLWIFRGLSLKC